MVENGRSGLSPSISLEGRSVAIREPGSHRLGAAPGLLLGLLGWGGLMLSNHRAIAYPTLPLPCPAAPQRIALAAPVDCAVPPAPQAAPLLGQADTTGGTDAAVEPPPSDDGAPPPLELDPIIIEQSPVLQRWLESTPDIANEIRHQPSFRSRLRVGYVQFPSTGNSGGFQVGVEDIFLIPGVGLTASGDYSRSSNGQRESYGAEARYYLLPLGSYVNLAPTVGYRSVSTPEYSTNGLDIGLRLMVVPSRGGAADFALSHHWVAPGSENEVGLTSATLGYAITPRLRLGSDLQFQNSRFGQDSRWGLSLEWLL